MSDKPADANSPNQQGSPENGLMRERIAQLIKSKAVKKSAEEAGIDLKELQKGMNADLRSV